MTLRGELTLAIGAIIVVQLLTLVGAVGLLSRVTPAVAQILSENEYSLQAVEEMLSSLAVTHPRADDSREAFASALEHARQNVTDERETPLIAELDALDDRAFAGDARARERLVAALQELADINRASMVRADERARRLGFAGAWSAALLGCLSVLVSVGVSRRLTRRIVRPVADLHRVVTAAQRGDLHARAHVDRGVADLEELAAAVNELVEARAREEQPSWQRLAARDRQLVLALLEREPSPTWVLSKTGELLAANTAGTDASLDGAVSGAALRGAAEALPDGYTRVPLGDDLVLVYAAQAREGA